ncbi:MAG: hypothetical protein ACPG8W_06620 [Candidatus Promineifilaceae bacterium]
MTQTYMKTNRANVEMVIKQLSEQARLIEEQIQAQAQGTVNTIQSGMWRGNGADRFVEEIQTTYIPDATRVVESCQLAINSIIRAIELLDEADTRTMTMASGLEDLIRQI